MSEMKSPLARLVLFMVFLSLLGVFAAGGSLYAIGPQHKDVQPPENSEVGYVRSCVDECMDKHCIFRPDLMINTCTPGIHYWCQEMCK